MFKMQKTLKDRRVSRHQTLKIIFVSKWNRRFVSQFRFNPNYFFGNVQLLRASLRDATKTEKVFHRRDLVLGTFQKHICD